ncbi:MAG TPA: hypothetical protein PKZ12_08550, partial [Smithellaceae bacterium]|nr:hypothetical protein [Smithellaceae bacterium]
MIISRLFCLVSILLLLISAGCGSKKTTVTGEPVLHQALPKVAAGEVKPAASPQRLPLQEKEPVAPVPEIVKKEEAKPANVIGCLLPLSGRYAEYGNKSLDAILL